MEENEVSTLGLAHLKIPSPYWAHSLSLQAPTQTTNPQLCSTNPHSASPANPPRYVPRISESVAATVYWEVPTLYTSLLLESQIQLHWQALHLPGRHSYLLLVVSFEK